MSSGIIFSIGANRSNVNLGEGHRGSTHSLTPPTNASSGVNAHQSSAATTPHKTFVHENDRHSVLDDDWFLAAHRGKEALAPNRGAFGDTAPSGGDIGSDAHTLAAAAASGGRSAGGRAASPKQAPWWKRLSASFGGGKPLMASSADNLLGEEMGAGDAVTSAAAYRARRKAASRTSASSAEPMSSSHTSSPAVPATRASVSNLGPAPLPQDPDSVSAWHHTDCDSYLLNYEQCLADNKFDLSAGGRCRGAWDAFAACKNDGRL